MLHFTVFSLFFLCVPSVSSVVQIFSSEPFQRSPDSRRGRDPSGCPRCRTPAQSPGATWAGADCGTQSVSTRNRFAWPSYVPLPLIAKRCLGGAGRARLHKTTRKTPSASARSRGKTQRGGHRV